ncbi:MAG: hypothetical protein CO129_12215 [Ignavibacteriales bacterium CG_4_9_14_3_um_filter_34_10]|nr:MAG: hypothetical protein CO129_12215 [Ignavibacteriales bacterium CG_4_9_14_3_um_filter_34_10]
MKSEIFFNAIKNRNRLKFLYGFSEIILEPYYVTMNKLGKKVIFGRINNSPEVKMFEYEKIFNLRVLELSKFSPIIPIMPV